MIEVGKFYPNKLQPELTKAHVVEFDGEWVTYDVILSNGLPSTRNKTNVRGFEWVYKVE